MGEVGRVVASGGELWGCDVGLQRVGELWMGRTGGSTVRLSIIDRCEGRFSKSMSPFFLTISATV